jgi:C1A family cysteine protease
MKSAFGLALFGSAFAAQLESASLFAEYVAKFGKNYPTKEEYEFRFTQFAKTYTEILMHNMKADKTSTMGLNKFSDWTPEERKKMNGFRKPDFEGFQYVHLDTSDLPAEINWVSLGAVNPVQDQGFCGSCWAFSAVAQMEGQHFVQSGELLKLSEQQCVDCDTDSYGCNGGWQDNCMYYVQWNGGISLEADYPYTA